MSRRLNYLLMMLVFWCGAPGAASAQITPPAILPQADVPLKKVEGKVFNSVTGAPIRRALVSFLGGSQRSTFTEDDGHFTFEDVRVGPLTLQARKPGFFSPQDLGIFVDTSKLSGAIDFKLVPAGLIYGQITGAEGEPLDRIPIQLFESKIMEGQRRWVAGARTVSDDDGRFRVAGQKPGRYFISAGPLLTGDLESSDFGYALTYYPKSPDRSSAMVIQLAAAQEAEINFTLAPVRVYKVSGVVTGGAPQSTGIQFVDASEAPLMFPSRYEPEVGGFEVTVPAGRYEIRAISNDGKSRALYARNSVAVSGNLSGITLTLQPLPAIPVIVRRDFARPVALQAQRGSSAVVRLVSPNGDRAAYSIQEGPRDDPSVLISNVQPGTYNVTVMLQGWGNDSIYVASVRCGTTDLLREALTVSAHGRVDPLEVVIRDDGARVEGTVRGAATNGDLLIVPDDEAKPQLGHYGPDGRFFNPPLAPGAYAVYAFDHADQIEFANPDVLRHYQSQAAHVTLSANQTTKITVDLIEAEQ